MGSLTGRGSSERFTRAGIAMTQVLTILPYDVRTAKSIMRTVTTLTSRGQATIPKQIRDSLGMKAGDRVTYTLLSDGAVLMRVKNKSVMDLARSLYKKGRKPVPIDQLSR